VALEILLLLHTRFWAGGGHANSLQGLETVTPLSPAIWKMTLHRRDETRKQGRSKPGPMSLKTTSAFLFVAGLPSAR
jgi:hypothetical protein